MKPMNLFREFCESTTDLFCYPSLRLPGRYRTSRQISWQEETTLVQLHCTASKLYLTKKNHDRKMPNNLYVLLLNPLDIGLVSAYSA